MENEKHNGETTRTKRRCTIWKRRTLLERYLIFICSAIFIALLVTIGVIFHVKHVYKRRLSSTCLSPECTQEAERIINYMDTSIDPCEDFYNFTCGSYLKTFPHYYDDRAFNKEAYDSMERLTKELIESLNEEEEGPEFLKKVKRVYQSCLNSPKDAVELIKEILERTKLERWPILEDEEAYMNRLEKNFAMTFIYGRVNPFLYFTRTINFTLGKIYLYVGETFVPEEVFLDDRDAEFIAKKKQYIEVLEYTLFKLKVPLNDLKYLVEEIIEFETDLANLTYKEWKNQDRDKQIKTTTTLKEFSTNCTGIKWTFIIRNIYDHFGHFDDFSEEIPVEYMTKEYIENLCKLLAETDDRIIYNYMAWSLLVQELSTTHLFYKKNMMEIRYDDYSTLHRWKFCVSDLIYSDFQPGVSYLVLNHLQSEETKKEVEGYVDEIKEVMDNMFRESRWMSSVSKGIARKKLKNIRADISYAPESLDVDLIEKYFSQFNVTDSYLENQLMILERETQWDFFNDSFDFKKNINIENPIVLSAYYLQEKIELSLGFLIPPYFRLGMPKYYNYGSVVVKINQELMSGFISLDFENSSIYEWSDETIEQFKQKRQCYIEQYSKFPLEYDGSMMNSTETSRQDIADNVAVGQAFKVYENYLQKNGPEHKLPGLDFTNEQMFFIRYGQSFCGPPKIYKGRLGDTTESPERYRTIGSLQNFPRFSEVFNCPANSLMNPKHKCYMY